MDLAPLLRELVRGLELLQAPADLRRLAVVVVDGRVGHALLGLSVGALDLLDELLNSHGIKVSAASGRNEASGHDFDPALFRRKPALHVEDLLERADRDFELVERGLPRRQALEPEARREEGHQHTVFGMPACKADQLVGEPSDERQEQDPARDQPGQRGRPRNAKTKIAITITQSRNAVPQRGWIRLNFCTRSGTSSSPAS